MGSINSINNINTNSVTNEKIKNKEKGSSESKMSTESKVLIGAVASLAVTAAAVAGIAIHKKIDNTKLLEKSAKEVKDILALPTKKSENTGKTVEETIENVLGKNSKIKPHNYDTAKEYPCISIYRDQGGYQDGFVTPNGMMVKGNTPPGINVACNAHMPKNSKGVSVNLSNKKGVEVYAGTVDGHNNKVVKLYITDTFDGEYRREDTGRKMIFSIISPDKNYTPVQKDLLKLAEHPKNVDINTFNKILKFKNANDENGKIIFENLRKYENLDYDLILSSIQSMANSIK